MKRTTERASTAGHPGTKRGFGGGRYAAPYSGFSCFGVGRYSIIYAPGELRVLRFNGKHASTSVFHLNPSGG